MAEKFFLFRKEPVTKFSVDDANTGDGLSVIGIPANRLSRITATLGKVTFYFKDAGVYDSYSSNTKEALPSTKVSVAAAEGEEYELIQQVMNFIARESGKAIMRFDVLSVKNDFPSAVLTNPSDVKAVVNTVPVVTLTGVLANDPANTDVTTTTTIALDGITFTSPSLLPVVDYNSDALSGYAAGDEIGSPNHWHNQGSGGSTYDITTNTNAPLLVDGGQLVGVREKAVAVDADPENLILANTLTVEDDYTMYFVTATIAYFSFGHSIVDGGSYVEIGFASGPGSENTNSEFWIQHNVQGASRPVKMQLDNTDGGTASYTYPDPYLEVGTSVWKGTERKPQTCYVFVLRRDKESNLYLHNHLGEIVGYAPANKVGTVGRTDGNLVIDNIGTGFRGTLARIGVIESDIGASEAARIAKDLHDRYAWRY